MELPFLAPPPPPPQAAGYHPCTSRSKRRVSPARTGPGRIPFQFPPTGEDSSPPAHEIGTARFELATPCTPSRCATRLRHAPPAEVYWLCPARARLNPRQRRVPARLEAIPRRAPPRECRSRCRGKPGRDAESCIPARLRDRLAHTKPCRFQGFPGCDGAWGLLMPPCTRSKPTSPGSPDRVRPSTSDSPPNGGFRRRSHDRIHGPGNDSLYGGRRRSRIRPPPHRQQAALTPRRRNSKPTALHRPEARHT